MDSWFSSHETSTEILKIVFGLDMSTTISLFLIRVNAQFLNVFK